MKPKKNIPKRCMRIGVESQPQGILAWMEKALAIVGAGRVGKSLGRRLRENGWKIQSVATRTEPTARRAVRFIGAGKAQAGISRHILSASTILICVPDDAIRETG